LYNTTLCGGIPYHITVVPDRRRGALCATGLSLPYTGRLSAQQDSLTPTHREALCAEGETHRCNTEGETHMCTMGEINPQVYNGRD